jgi:hypothetical protein
MTPGHGVPTQEQQMAHVEAQMRSIKSRALRPTGQYLLKSILESIACLLLSSPCWDSNPTPNVLLNSCTTTPCLVEFSAAQKSTPNILSNACTTAEGLSGFYSAQESALDILSNLPSQPMSVRISCCLKYGWEYPLKCNSRC